MERRRLSEIEAERAVGPVFETQVHVKEGFTEELEGGARLSASEISFAPGERTTLHTHTIRQLLFVTGGKGIVASDDDRFEVEPGDVISIPPDEEHWHGAAPASSFRHLSVVVRDDEHGGTVAVEEPEGRRSE